MDYGFIKVATAIPSCRVADCRFNSEQIISLLQEADQQEVEITLFPELCVTGYTCGDLFGQPLLLQEAEQALLHIVEATRERETLAIVGCPLTQGNRLFNTAVVIGRGVVYGIVPKSHLPNYKEFYERRWFCPASESGQETIRCGAQEVPFGTRLLFTSGEVSLAIELCEDMWTAIPPSSYHALHGANILANLSASDEVVGKHEYLRGLVAQQSARTVSAYLYASAGGGESSTDLVFGGNGIISENGIILAESRRFADSSQLITTEIDIERLMNERRGNTGFCNETTEDSYRTIPVRLPNYALTRLDRTVDPHPFIPQVDRLRDERCEEIFNIQVSGLVKRLRHTGAKSAVVGISGGLDSTLALLVTAKAFDRLGLSRRQIQGITMPGFGTTDRTYRNALDLIRSLGVTLREISIKEACTQHFKDIGHDISLHDVTYENSQARERTQILMDIAN
ncbi:MAG: NAD(+) synthase, partial [Porphyromonadaceae bacterium]|nr:NAD(+) synthase [Porphyromonadaceae bacterium]